jgi:anion-transporting  ArsA/GET3 family ATPase
MKETASTALADKKLIVVCGSGGVGKTTTAASLGLRAAAEGKKVIVLTIDPAKRLATSLGLEKLTGKPRKISKEMLEAAVGPTEGSLSAMMLDTKSTFDAIVTKYASSKETEKKILENKIYQHLSDMIAGSQEYMAMEKLYEIVSGGGYDLVVIDTPPTTHAIDFLEAPERMVNAIGNSMIHLLIKPAMAIGKTGFNLFSKGSAMILKVFDRITGFAFLQEISEMLFSFQDLLGGFKSRAEDVKKILQDPDTAFVLVAACEDKSVAEVKVFREKLSEAKLPLDGLIVNRVHPEFSEYDDKARALKDRVGDALAEKMTDVFLDYQKVAKRDHVFIKELKKSLGPDRFITTVPLFETDIHDLAGLYRLSKYV